MNKRLLPGLISLLAAQPAFSLDLMETYEKALSYDSGIASSLAQFQAQQATSDVSKSALLPKISAVGSASYTSFEPRNIPQCTLRSIEGHTASSSYRPPPGCRHGILCHCKRPRRLCGSWLHRAVTVCVYPANGL